MISHAALGQLALGRQYDTSAASFSMAIEAGSVTLTGRAAALRITRTLAIGVGAFTVSGQAAAVRSTRRITAAAGALSVTGQAATIRPARSLACSPYPASDNGYIGFAALGQLSLGGTVGRQEATFIIAGHPARLPVSMPAATGSFSVTSPDSGLIVWRGVRSGTGSFVLTGNAAGVLTTRRMNAEMGVFSLSGNVIEMSRVRPPRIRGFHIGSGIQARNVAHGIRAHVYGG